MSEWIELAAELATETDPDRRRAIADALHEAYLAAPSPLSGTTAAGLPYPSPTDPVAAGADAIRALAEAIDAKRPRGVIATGFGPAASTDYGAAYGSPVAFAAVPVIAGRVYTIIASINGNQITAVGVPVARVSVDGVDYARLVQGITYQTSGQNSSVAGSVAISYVPAATKSIAISLDCLAQSGGFRVGINKGALQVFDAGQWPLT